MTRSRGKTSQVRLPVVGNVCSSSHVLSVIVGVGLSVSEREGGREGRGGLPNLPLTLEEEQFGKMK